MEGRSSVTQECAKVSTADESRQPLDAIFRPKNVAVIGATEREGSVGRTVLWNLISSPFGGTVYPVNSNRPSVLGIRSYKSVSEIPEKIDLAVIVTAAPTVPDVIAECVQLGVPGAVIISAGFKEVGPEGVELERRILETARRGDMRIIGPNCLGVMNAQYGLNATFAKGVGNAGNVGFISQSGALCTAVLDWAQRENVGFSTFVSVGSMLDVSWGDLIYYLGDDPTTHSIVMYMETIGDARSFLSAAREVALTKPIIVIKPGRTEGAAKAAASHTGSLTGSDEVLEAAFRRSGVLRVYNIADLFYMAGVLSKQPRPQGKKLTIVTNAGGPGVLATDSLIGGGGELAVLSADAKAALNEALPAHWSHNNPIDVLGDATAERYAKALEIAAKDPNSDGMLVILTPQAMTDPTAVAKKLAPYCASTGKPILASWMGGPDVEEGEAVLTQAGIPAFRYPDTAARVFNYMWRYADNLKSLYETPRLPPDTREHTPDRKVVDAILTQVRAENRTILTEFESKKILEAYGIPAVPTEVAGSPKEASEAAHRIGYPVVVKLYSRTITHKTDVGGVKLNLQSPSEVESAFNEIRESVQKKSGGEGFDGVTVQPMVRLDGYEIILGSSIDPQFGPVLLFGSGGQLVEVMKDRALGLPPLNTVLARRMVEQTLIAKAFKGVRGRPPVDQHALEQLLVRFSQLVVEQRWIKEIDINPLLVSAERIVALDARVVLHPATMKEEELPLPAVRPYPAQYSWQITSKKGETLKIRPIRPEDEPLLVKFHEQLSDRTVYKRFLSPMLLSQRISHERLSRICFIDYQREMALVAERPGTNGTGPSIVGVARLRKAHAAHEGALSIVVSDEAQGQGIGMELVRKIIETAKVEKLNRIIAPISAENPEMRRVAERMGFRLESKGPDSAIAVLDL